MIPLLLVVGLAASISAQEYQPVPGGELLDRLRSPRFLAATENTATTESVSGDVINPAGSALKQRIHLDAGYAAIIGDEAWDGHATSAGVSVPTRMGVISGSLNYLSVEYPELFLGQRGSLNLSFAKDLYPNLLFGTGLRLHTGVVDGDSGFGAGLDLGIVHLLGSRGPFPDVRWGLAVTQMGVGFAPTADTTGSPAPFTPAADLQATMVQTGSVELTVHTGFSAPSFQNLRFRAGSSARFFDRFDLTLGWDIDLAEQNERDGRAPDSLLPSVGITARFTTGESDRPWNQSDIAVHSAWAPLYDGVWAAGAGANVAIGVIDRNPPEIRVEYPETAYVSPNNDGAADQLLLPLSISDERYITQWALEIRDSQGTVVRTLENKEQRPENQGFRSLIDRLVAVDTGIEVPDSVRWDGRTDAGGLASDGEYSFVVRAGDDNGNTSTSVPRTMVIDATPPEVDIQEPENPDDLVFSPNDDGNKDSLVLSQSTSSEDQWTVQILDAGDAVVYEELREGAVDAFRWDGRSSQGTLVPDGVYTYRVAAQDRALNEGSARLSNIIVDTVATPIGLSLDLGAFSPNGDGRQDSVVLTPEVPVLQGIRSATFTVRDEDGTAVRTRQFRDSLPTNWRFDGRKDRNEILPEGEYRITLGLEYRNGNAPEAISPTVELDVTPPQMNVRASIPVFSPNGDGNRDTVALLHSTERLPRWEAELVGPDGRTVRRYQWSGEPESRLVWDGLTQEGGQAQDGSYRYVLTGEDRAGNLNTHRPVAIELDTRETPVFIATSREAFSPNGDRRSDQIDILPSLQDPEGIETFEIAILDAWDQVVARISDGGVPQDRYPWDGRGSDGTVVEDGSYRVRFSAEYRHGNRPRAVSAPFDIDTRAPRATVRAQDRIFSPDGDGEKDRITFSQTSSAELRWVAEIISEATETPLRSWEFSGELEPLSWDGTDDDGNLVPDGTYRYRVTSVDPADNRTVVSSAPFRTDTREVEARLAISNSFFSPNGDGVLDTTTLSPELTANSPVDRWSVALLNSQGSTVWELESPEGLAPVVWDGRTNGAIIGDGEYRAQLTVELQRGDTIQVSAPRPVVVDTLAPAATVELSSPVISPNGDGNLDGLTVAHETSSEDRWIANVLDSDDQVVARWEWVDRAPEELRFTGLGTDRTRLADGMYRYRLSATDRAGNTTTVGPREFEIFTAETPVELFARHAAFSPNGDGVLDRLDLGLTVGDTPGLQAYDFTVVNAQGETVYSQSGPRLPENLSWDGRTDENQIAPEGSYVAAVTVRYRHGNRPHARTGVVELDVTAPALTVEPAFTIFSPDGDGRRDSLRLAQQSDPAPGWEAAIVNVETGETVRSFSWAQRAGRLDWDGTDEAGNTVDDGMYRYTVEGTDAAGNRRSVTLPEITVDTRPTQLFITLDRRTVSPNGDGRDDALQIGTITRRTDGAQSAELRIIDATGATVRRFPLDAVEADATILWNGEPDGERPAETAPDGVYTVEYRVTYDNGAVPVATSPSITLDTQGPSLGVDLQGLPFSPDNDGLNDELGIALTVEDISDIESWEFEILDRNRRAFQRFSGTGRPGARLLWDGRSSDGELVISAEDYPYRFTAVDNTGNASTIEGEIPIDILVVRDGNLLKVQISNINFAPNSPVLELDPDTPTGAKNIAVLDRLVEVFDKYRSYEIRVEGHAVNISGTDREEQDELQPLSTARAETVRAALIERGMDGGRIDTLGRGGQAPIVPHTDLDNRWKNRRVEFILLR